MRGWFFGPCWGGPTVPNGRGGVDGEVEGGPRGPVIVARRRRSRAGVPRAFAPTWRILRDDDDNDDDDDDDDGG